MEENLHLEFDKDVGRFRPEEAMRFERYERMVERNTKFWDGVAHDLNIFLIVLFTLWIVSLF